MLLKKPELVFTALQDEHIIYEDFYDELTLRSRTGKTKKGKGGKGAKNSLKMMVATGMLTWSQL